MKRLKKLYKKYTILIWTFIGIFALIFLWWLISFLLNTTLFPGPQSVFPQFIYNLEQGETYLAIGGTILRLIISVLLASVFGIALGSLAGINIKFRSFFKPFVILFKTIPTAAVMFILIALLKPKFAPIIIVFLIIFPLIYESTISGFDNIDVNLIDETKLDERSKFTSIFRIYIPLSWKYIRLGLISSIGLGMKVSIMSEIIAGSDSVIGLGKLIRDASLIADMKNVLAYSIIGILIIGIIDIVNKILKKKLSN